MKTETKVTDEQKEELAYYRVISDAYKQRFKRELKEEFEQVGEIEELKNKYDKFISIMESKNKNK